MLCCKNTKCCGLEREKIPIWKRLMTREFLAVFLSVGLSVCLLISVATPWYTIEGYGLPPPQDTVAAVFWWTGMEVLFTPPYNGTRVMTLGWNDMSNRMPRDVFHSAVAMGMLGFIFNNVLLVALIFGLMCRGTGYLLDKMTCGMFKWFMVALAFFTLMLVVLSWTIFLLINDALQRSNLCVGAKPYFPVKQQIGVNNETLPILCEGYWCIGFGGTAKSGDTRFVWGPSIGWVTAVVGTGFIFFIFCVTLTIDQHRYTYEQVGDRRKTTKKTSKKKKAGSDIKMAKRRAEDMYNEEEEERTPLRGSSRLKESSKSNKKDKKDKKSSSSKIGDRSSRYSRDEESDRDRSRSRSRARK